MAVQGTIGVFDQGTEDWRAYCECLEHITANDVNDLAKQNAIHLSVYVDTYHLIHSLTAPEWPTVKPFTGLTLLVKDHLNLPPLAIMQRFKCNSRTQKESELVSECVAD